jgi:mRNA-degrading endonuclease RelE of RelBE toxin-antitoxin system
MEIEVFQVAVSDEFRKQYKLYFKKRKYHTLEKQIKELINDFKKGEFDSSATPLTHSEEPVKYDIFKMRMANPDAGEGKSGGYRIIYMIRTEHKLIVLLTLYSKSDQNSITDREIELLADGYFMSELKDED